ncbi:hypothetical protein [Halorubrum halophilum]|uniref:hypothetical protein n=1 Tax=Halorubrum halophilum TaxID=413816 RepID=UPI00186B2E57|nr:hypothetical protein [Halorubrum halophilum]
MIGIVIAGETGEGEVDPIREHLIWRIAGLLADGVEWIGDEFPMFAFEKRRHR